MNYEMYYKKAFSAKGENDSLYFKGVCYTFGYGVSIDLQKAKKSYEEGARCKNPKCMYGLAVLLLKCKEKEKDEEAYKLFQDAFEELYRQAQLNDPISQRMISCYYLFGDRGVSRNLQEAQKWLLQAANNGDADAQMNVAHCYETGNVFNKDLCMAMDWYAKSAAQGNHKASKKLVELRRKYNE